MKVVELFAGTGHISQALCEHVATISERGIIK